jgi:hypothetical protein
MSRLGLLVTDASPLITLAAADALECLTIPGLPVVIPDMVYFEVTQDIGKLGAGAIVDWARRHSGQIRIAPTEVFSEFQTLRSVDPATRSRGRGEQAAAEVLSVEVANDPELEALLIYEDNDVRNQGRRGELPERVTALSTGDLLHELEVAGKIQSSDQVLDAAAANKRNVERQRVPQNSPEAR